MLSLALGPVPQPSNQAAPGSLYLGLCPRLGIHHATVALAFSVLVQVSVVAGIYFSAFPFSFYFSPICFHLTSSLCPCPLCLCQPRPFLDTPVYFLSSFLCLHLSLSPSVLVGLFCVSLFLFVSVSVSPCLPVCLS